MPRPHVLIYLAIDNLYLAVCHPIGIVKRSVKRPKVRDLDRAARTSGRSGAACQLSQVLTFWLLAISSKDWVAGSKRAPATSPRRSGVFPGSPGPAPAPPERGFARHRPFAHRICSGERHSGSARIGNRTAQCRAHQAMRRVRSGAEIGSGPAVSRAAHPSLLDPKHSSDVPYAL